MKDLENLHQKLEAENRAKNYNLDASQLDKLLVYLATLDKWNKVFNLTGIKDMQEMLSKHIFETLQVLPYMQNYIEKSGKAWQTAKNELSAIRVLDAGAGAGIPSLILATILPNINFVAVDTNGKKTRFMVEASAKMALDNVQVIQARLPNLEIQADFDLIISRAFTNFADFLQITKNLAHKESLWFAMKTRVSEEELQAIPQEFEILEKAELSTQRKTSLYVFKTNKLNKTN